jgi:hypothetical protein
MTETKTKKRVLFIYKKGGHPVSLSLSLSLAALLHLISPPLHERSMSCSHSGKNPPMK